MAYRFGSYCGADLARCGEAFQRMLRRASTARGQTPAKLRAVALAWFDRAAADGALSVAGPVLRELGAVPTALDLAHVAASDGQLLLAVAHEPPGRLDRFGYVYLLARAAALAATPSRAKILVSNWRGAPAHGLLVDCVLELREQLDDCAPWLWLESGSEADPAFTLLEPR